MDDKSFNIRVPKKWARTGLVVLVTAIIVAPLTALASHQFTDVPDSNIFHGDISWLADANVTKGCNPPTNDQFCPKDTVTRESMAAFLHRLAVNQVVDAGELDGKQGVAYSNPIWGEALDWSADGQGAISGTTMAGDEILTLTVEPPVDGVLSLVYNLGVFDTAELYYGGAWLQYNNNTCAWADRVLGSSSYFNKNGATDNAFDHVTGAAVKATTQGTHTVTLCAGLFTGTSITRNDANIVATFSDSGSATVAGESAPTGGSADPTG